MARSRKAPPKPLPTAPVADVLNPPKKRPVGRPPGSGKRVAKISANVAEAIINGQRFLEKQGKKLDPRATPLDVLVEAMREAYEVGGAMFAASYAKEAAPYIHAKIANIELRPVGSNPTPQTDVQKLGLAQLYVDFIDVEATEVKDEDV